MEHYVVIIYKVPHHVCVAVNSFLCTGVIQRPKHIANKQRFSITVRPTETAVGTTRKIVSRRIRMSEQRLPNKFYFPTKRIDLSGKKKTKTKFPKEFLMSLTFSVDKMLRHTFH